MIFEGQSWCFSIGIMHEVEIQFNVISQGLEGSEFTSECLYLILDERYAKLLHIRNAASARNRFNSL